MSKIDTSWNPKGIKWPKEEELIGMVLPKVVLPPKDKRCRVPRGCIREDCCYHDTGFFGSPFMYCIFQQKCIIRGSKASQKRIKEAFDLATKSLSVRDRIKLMFETMPYSCLSANQTEWVEKLYEGEWGFLIRRKLSEKQLKILEAIYFDGKRKELDEKGGFDDTRTVGEV